MSDTTSALFTVEAFYSAFATRDFATLRGAWAETAPLSCIHPGAEPLVGRDSVMESWRAILENPQTPEIRCLAPQVLVHGDMAIVTCHEDLDGDLLCATNVLVREGAVWKIVHHQAGPLAYVPEIMPEPDDGGGSGAIN